MCLYNYKEYDISVCETKPFNPGSADNKHYEKIFWIEKSTYKKYIEVKIETYDSIRYVLFVVSYHTLIHYHSSVALHVRGLFMMFNEVLCVFDPETLEIEKQTTIDKMFGTMFDVYPYKKDYILYGETDIYRVSGDLDILWRFSGRDIFVRYKSEEPAFEMKEDRICLYDFLDNYYEIDYDGKMICEKSSKC